MHLSNKQRQHIAEALADVSPPRRLGRRKPAGVVQHAANQEKKRRAAALDRAFNAMLRPALPPGRKPQP